MLKFSIYQTTFFHTKKSSFDKMKMVLQLKAMFHDKIIINLLHARYHEFYKLIDHEALSHHDNPRNKLSLKSNKNWF